MISVLTDFGMSFFSPENNGCPLPDNPEDYVLNEVCTRYPPEYQHQLLGESVPLGEATDVWGIGRVAWDLVANRCTATGPVRDERDSRGEYIPLSSFEDPRNRVINDRTTTLTGGKLFPAAANYSDGLRDLVRECLNFHTEHRPSLEKISRAATRYLEDTDGAMDVVRDRDGLGLLELDLEEFEIGKVLKVPESKKRKRGEDDEDSGDEDSKDEDGEDEDSEDEDSKDENSEDDEDSESD
jgi:serine/threonine protein kinase